MSVMVSAVFRSIVASVALASAAVPARAQQIPSPAQAQQMLQQDPSLAARLQDMMKSSGLTPEQVRERLRAQGYPDSLLDQYLPGAAGDSTLVPGAEVFAAVRALGIGDSTALDSMSMRAQARRRVRARADSAFLDTLQHALQDDSTRAALRAVLRSRDLQREQIDSGFTVFGIDLFQNQSTLFDANAAGGVDPNYRFGPGDRLVLFLTGDVEKSYTLNVTREGFVVIPEVGQVSVAGLTRSQLESALYDRLGRVYSGVRRGGGTTHFYIDVSQIGANQVFVNGDVQHPGSYRVSRAGTVLNALYAAGGPTANGSMRRIEVRRGNETVATLDFYDYALNGDASNDVRLENGDVIFVPPRGPQVRVAGKVIRPAVYEIKPNQTVAELIRMAGGFTETADRRRVQIDRVVPPAERTTSGTDRKLVDVPSDLFANAPVRGGDVVRVSEIAPRVANRLRVIGNVWAPGPVGYTPGMHLYDALRRAGGLKPDSYLGQVLVSRLQPDSTREMLRTAVYDTTGRPVNDIVLHDADEIQVFSTTEFRPKRYITVNGAVRKPGRIPYRDGMTLRDAVLLAGGPVEGALLTDAEVARLPENRAAGVTATTMDVPLDSTYVFERGANGDYIGPPGVPIPTAHAPEVPLEPYDAVLIKRQPQWQLQQTVAVDGEVRYPGAYSLTSTTERLSDIIARAGGLTTAAYPDGIIFVRKKNGIGRIGVDLPAVLKDPRNIDNLQLVDGDSVFIPRYTPVVVVRGAVQSQVGVSWVPGADLDYYIRSAGGATTKGDSKRAYVTQPNGKVDTRHKHFGLWRSEPEPQPGSTVVVPEKDPNDKHDWLQIATATTSLLGSLVAVIAILGR
jgi:protein involved in polysaccharide export with SLBB domain